MIEISEELWADIVPNLKTARISTDVDMEESAGPVTDGSSYKHVAITNGLIATQIIAMAQSDTQAQQKQIVVNVQDTDRNIEKLFLPLFLDSTIRQQKDLIIRHDERLPPHITLRHEQYSNLCDDKQLHEYGIRNLSVVSLSTELDVRLVIRNSYDYSVTLVTFATVRVLKLLLCAKEGNRWDHPYDQALTCAGEILDDTRKLGSYPQIVSGCNIFVNNTRGECVHLRLRISTKLSYKPTAESSRTLIDLITLIIRIDSVYGEFSGIEVGDLSTYSVLPESTILDLRILLSNKTGTRLEQLTLFTSSDEFVEDHDVVGDRFEPMDTLSLTIDYVYDCY